MRLADRPYQSEAIFGGRGYPGVYRALRENRTSVLVLPTGCHAAGQELLAADGSLVRVEDVAPGDRLMGVSGDPRAVLRLCRGDGEMYRITPNKGEPWVVNGDHILTLVKTQERKDGFPSQSGGEIVDVSVKTWLAWPKWRKHIFKLFRSPVLTGAPVPFSLPPYVLGVLLGDGSLTGCRTDLIFSKPDVELAEAVAVLIAPLGLSVRGVKDASGKCPSWRISGTSGPGGNVAMTQLREMGLLPVRSEARFVPPAFLRATWHERLELLAGLMDTDGYTDKGGYEFTSKSRQLAADVAYLGRSVGLMATIRSKEARCQTGAGGTYWRTLLSGDCRRIPVRLERKRAAERKMDKDALRFGFTIEPTGEREPFYGFTLDGDGRYLLADHTVTHNSGKTIVFSRVVEACVQRGKRVLILAHREELIAGAHEKLVAATSVDALQIGIEMAGDRAGDHHAVVIASVQTLQGARLQRLNAADFGLVVVDEAHHVLAKTYRKVLDHFPDSKILGVTATPDRLDGRGLGQVFASVAYVYGIADAIRDGFLVRIVGEEILGGEAFDLSAVRTTAGDLNQGDLAEVLERDPAVALVARGTVDKAGDRPTICFAVSVQQARLIADYMNAYVGREVAVALDGTAPKEVRRAVKARFERGDFQFLCNCALYTEGVDIPSIACVSIARPTKSRALYSQMVGRGLRLLGATMEESVAAGKESALILDFTGVSGKHRLVTTLDVLDGNADEEVRRRVLKRATGGGPVDMMEQLELTSRELAEEARRKALEEVKYRTREIADPFTLLGVKPRPLHPGSRPATLRQLQALARDKIPGAAEQLIRLEAGQPTLPGDIDLGQAGKLMSAILKRRDAGKCSLKVAGILAKHGLCPDVSAALGKWAMDQLAGNGWQPTEQVLAHPELVASKR